MSRAWNDNCQLKFENFDALAHNTTGNDNTANGFDALALNTTGSDNTANGFEALFGNTTGNQNTANGAFALSSASKIRK